MRIRPWQLSLLALILCGLALFATLNYRASRLAGHDWLFRRLPTDHAVVAGIDVAALREAGMLDLLSTPRALQELGYRQLTDQGGLDDRSDIDYVAASISIANGERHYILDGRFDWEMLFTAARQAGGRCLNTFCDFPGFGTTRNISFLPIGPNILGLSVAPVSQAAWALANDYTGVQLPSVPKYPVFLAMDAGMLATADAIPISIDPIAQILSTADFVVLGIHVTPAGKFEVVMDADCLSDARAASIQSRLAGFLAPDPLVASIFGGGTVWATGRSVHGRWPVELTTLQAMAGQ